MLFSPQPFESTLPTRCSKHSQVFSINKESPTQAQYRNKTVMIKTDALPPTHHGSHLNLANCPIVFFIEKYLTPKSCAMWICHVILMSFILESSPVFLILQPWHFWTWLFFPHDYAEHAIFVGISKKRCCILVHLPGSTKH